MIAGLVRPVGKSEEKQLFFFSGIAIREKNYDLLKECKKKLLAYAKKNGYSRVIMKSYDYNNYSPASIKEFIPFDRAEFVLDLTIDEQKLIKGFNPDLRRRVRKAKRSGVNVKHSYSPGLLEVLFQLLESTQNMRVSKGYDKYNLIPMPFMNAASIKNLLEKRNAVFFYAEFNGQIIGMQFMVMTAGRAYGLLMGISPEGYKLAAPSALFYDTTIFFKNNGYTSYNMGAVPLGEKNKGIRKFKLSLGTQIIHSAEETTGFLMKPLTRLNKYIQLKRILMNIYLPWKIKKILIKTIDSFFIKGRDEY